MSSIDFGFTVTCILLLVGTLLVKQTAAFATPGVTLKMKNDKNKENKKIFVAGGTGVIGKALVPKLVQAGHDVTVATRSPDKMDEILALGATPVVCDILDPNQLDEVFGHPDIVIHQVTAFASPTDPFGDTNLVRTQGTANLIQAARHSETVQKFIAQSVSFLCQPTKVNTDASLLSDALNDESTPLLKGVPAIQSVVDALAQLEKQVLDLNTDDKMEGIVLRYGHFYGPNTFYATDGWITNLVKGGQYPIIEGGTGTYSFIEIKDAASATVKSLKKGKPGIYTIVDDTPVCVEDWVTHYAQLVDGPVPPRTGGDDASSSDDNAAEQQLDPFTTFFMTEQKGVSNQKAKMDLDWSPSTPSWSAGFATLLSEEE